MLVFTRKAGEAVVVTGLPGNSSELKISVLAVKGGRVRLGFETETQIDSNRIGVLDRNPVVAERETKKKK